MRMAELSRRTGVPVPTIKYYLREGVLPPGERTSPNQARYDEEHVHRLKMVRALVEVAGMSIASVRDVLAAMDLKPYKILGEVQDRLPPTYQEGEGEHWDAAYQVVTDLLDRHGWDANPDSPPGRALTTAIKALYDMGRPDLVVLADSYAEGVAKMAVTDVRTVIRNDSIEDTIEGVVIGTVIGDAMISALRRLAHQYFSDELLGEAE